MGQSLKTLAPGNKKKVEDIGKIIEEDFYEKYFTPKDDSSSKALPKEWTSAEFYRAVCCAVEEINHKLENTQLRVPATMALEVAYHKHHPEKEKPLTKEEFQRILKEVIPETRFTGIGAKDTFLCIFGVPVAALFLKQRVMPGFPNEIFVPGITSVTVLVLAMLNKM